jgi:hypothetical protein
MREVFELCEFIVIATAVLVGFMVLFVFCLYRPLSIYSCSNYMKATSTETKHLFVTCYIKNKKGDWLTRDQFDKTLIANGLRDDAQVN